MSLLMCKDVPIYDISTNEILRPDLVPIKFTSKKDFESWKKRRAFVVSNRASEYTVSQVSPSDIALKRRLSLSDCYWIKIKKETKSFLEITPYTNQFTQMGILVKDSSVPDQNLGGSVLKNWHIDKLTGYRFMLKNMREEWVENEIISFHLIKRLGLECNHVFPIAGNKNLVGIYNMTDVNWMMLTFRELGVKCNGYSVNSVLSVYHAMSANVKSDYVLFVILADAIIGNFDREKNMGNWAVMKNSDNGYTVASPLYDFNLAHRKTPHYFLGTIAKNFKNEGYGESVMRILLHWEETVKVFGEPQFYNNLLELKERLS